MKVVCHIRYNGEPFCARAQHKFHDKAYKLKIERPIEKLYCCWESLKGARECRKFIYSLIADNKMSEKELKIQIALGTLPKVEVVRGGCAGLL